TQHSALVWSVRRPTALSLRCSSHAHTKIAIKPHPISSLFLLLHFPLPNAAPPAGCRVLVPAAQATYLALHPSIPARLTELAQGSTLRGDAQFRPGPPVLRRAFRRHTGAALRVYQSVQGHLAAAAICPLATV